MNREPGEGHLSDVKWIALLATVGILGVLVWVLTSDPYSQEKRAISRVHLLRRGMTEPEVWRVLGLEDYGLNASTSGSGARNAWPSNYFLTKEKILHIAWDLTKEPSVLLGAQVEPNVLGYTFRDPKPGSSFPDLPAKFRDNR